MKSRIYTCDFNVGQIYPFCCLGGDQSRNSINQQEYWSTWKPMICVCICICLFVSQKQASRKRVSLEAEDNEKFQEHIPLCLFFLPPFPPLYLHFCMRVRFKDFGSLSLETEQMENAWKVVPLGGIFVFVCHFYVCIFLAPTGAPVAIVVYYTSWSGGNFFRFQIGVGGLIITYHSRDGDGCQPEMRMVVHCTVLLQCAPPSSIRPKQEKIYGINYRHLLSLLIQQ